MGWILIVTAVLVLVPVGLQLRSGDYGIRDFGGYLLFAAGLVLVGAAERWAVDGTATALTVAGLVAVLSGLLIARPGHMG